METWAQAGRRKDTSSAKAIRRHTIQLRQHKDKQNGMSSGKANDKQHETLLESVRRLR